MKRAVLISLSIVLFLGIKACTEPYDNASESVEHFIKYIKKKKGMSALKYLHPSFRDNLIKDVKLPFELTEMKPSEILACLLSSMGTNIEDAHVENIQSINENTLKVRVKIEDKNELEKLFNFILIKEGNNWYIADISPYTIDKK